MAKQRDDRNPKPGDEEPQDVVPLGEIDELEEVEEVVEEGVAEAGLKPGEEPPQTTKMAGRTPPKTPVSGRAPQPTALAPQQPKEEEPVEAAEVFEEPPAGMPNLSLDEPPASGVVEEAMEVLHEEPAPGGSSVVEVSELAEEMGSEVLAAEPAGGSSVVEVTELAEDVSEEIHDVLSEEPAKPGGGSSVVDVSEVVEDVASEAKPESPPPAKGDEMFETHDFLDLHDEKVPGSSSIFGAERPGPEKTAATDSMARKDEALDEILESTESSDKHDRKKAEKPQVEDDFVDLGSDPDVFLEQPSGPAAAQKGKMPPAQEADDVTDTDEEDLVDESALIDEESSAVDLGKSGQPLSGVDPVAEALESGVKRGDAEKAASAKGKKAPKLTDDEAADLFLKDDEDKTPVPKKKVKEVALDDEVEFDDDEKKKGPAKKEEVEEVGAEALLDDEEMPAPKKKKGKADEADEADADELAARAFLDDEETPVTKKKAKAVFEEEEEAVASEEEEEKPVLKKKKGKKKDEDDEEEAELVGAGAGKGRRARPAPKPKYGRRWLGGMFLMTLLLGGAGAAIWFAKPDLIDEAYKLTPNYKPPKKEVPKVDPPWVQARAKINNKEFDDALALLENADKTPVNLSTRAEARWLKYLKTQTEAKKPLEKGSAEVIKVQTDVKEANNDLLWAQIDKALQESELRASLKATEKNVGDLKEMVKKAEDAKKQVEKQVTGIADALVKEKILDAKDKLDQAVFEKILKDLSGYKSGLAAVNKALKDAKIDDAGDKGVEKLILAKRDVEGMLSAVNKLLADAKFKGVGAKGLAEVIAARDKLAKDRDELDQAIKGAYKELAAGGLAPPGANPRAKIIEAAKLARTKAESPLAIPLTQLASSLSGLGTGTGKVLQKSFDVAALTSELNFYRIREPLIVPPDRKMDTYITLFQDVRRKDPSELGRAVNEAAWVLSKDSKATPEARAKALFVTGLATRNLENFGPARKNLALAVKLGGNAPWVKQADATLKELTDPAAYYLPRAAKFADAGNLASALDALTLGLKALPDNPRLLAFRSLLRYESARGNTAKLEAAQEDIRADAAAAAKDPSAVSDAAYVVGLLEEELGDFDKAEDEYRKAIKAHQGNPDDASRYVIALARLLQRDRSGAAAPPTKEEQTEPKPKIDPEPKKVEPKKKDKETKKAEPKKKDAKEKEAEPQKDAETKKEDARAGTLRSLLGLALAGVQLPGEEEEDPLGAARIQESIELAKKLIQSANPKIKGQGYMILGQALSKKGKRTEGMREYVKGLELLFPGTQSKEMSTLLEEHPAFQQPDASRTEPALAEQFFGQGLHLYWTRNYAEAEIQFKQAVQYYNQDARYQYFLGLSLLPQKGSLKRDAAYHAFETGARLEAANRPSMGEVNASLERIQGPLRNYLNSFRQRALLAPAGPAQ
jgi:hypothetical protein